MSKKRVVITGIGVIAPNGTGKDAFWSALEKGASGIKPMTLVDTTYFKAKTAGECSDFKPEDFLGSKGLRNLTRTTTLLCSAAKLALQDASLEITEDTSDETGVVTATTLSVSLDIAQFTKESVQEGPQFISPALFPPTTMNYPSSQVSIRHKIKGFNTTIATGYTAGLDALKYAVDSIRAGRVKTALVAGVESLSFSGFVGFYKAGFLAGLKGDELCCPFDARHNGIIFGEGAAVLVVEEAESARARGAAIYAEVLGVEASFDAYRTVEYDPRGRGLKQSMRNSLEAACLSEEDIDCIMAAANSVSLQDRIESLAIEEVFNIYAKGIPVSAVKSMMGESMSAAGTLQVAASVGAIMKGFIPPTVNHEKPAPDCNLDYTPGSARKQGVRNVMVNNLGPGGNNSSAIIAQYEE